MLAWAVQVTAGMTSSSERHPARLGQPLQPRCKAEQPAGQPDRIDQHERLQFHPQQCLAELTDP